MIEYSAHGQWVIRKLFRLNGSVFPSSFFVAFPCAMLAVVLKILIEADVLEFFKKEDSILRETQAWSGFSFLVGFLIVFRTSQAYNRFWDGCTATHQMRAEWFDGCSALVCFAEHARNKVEDKLLDDFRGRIVRLFSMLHACALAELETINVGSEHIEQVSAFKFDVLDPAGFDAKSLASIKFSDSRVELVYSWIQTFIVESMLSGVLSIPPPILSRAFQEIANGMVAFHDAVKITYIPFPFPYAQTCDCLLVMHWLVTPIVIPQWTSSPLWAGVFVFIQVFILWALNFIATEIENPFGTDPNDIDGGNMQKDMNRHLLLLLRSEVINTPKLQRSACQLEDAEAGRFAVQSFHEIWSKEECLVFEGSTSLRPREFYDFTRGKVEAHGTYKRRASNLSATNGTGTAHVSSVRRASSQQTSFSHKESSLSLESRISKAYERFPPSLSLDADASWSRVGSPQTTPQPTLQPSISGTSFGATSQPITGPLPLLTRNGSWPQQPPTPPHTITVEPATNSGDAAAFREPHRLPSIEERLSRVEIDPP